MDEDLRPLFSGYGPVMTIPVHWGDMDALSHVNNVVYFRWLESSRVTLIDSLKAVADSKMHGIGPILASAKCDYRLQTRFPDTVSVASRIDHVGRTSVRLKQVVVSHEQRAIVAEGEAILVLYNYHAGKPVPIEGVLRSALETMLPGKD